MSQFKTIFWELELLRNIWKRGRLMVHSVALWNDALEVGTPKNILKTRSLNCTFVRNFKRCFGTAEKIKNKQIAKWCIPPLALVKFYHLVIYISRFLFLRISCEQNITATLLTTVVEKGVEFRGFQGVRTLLDSLYTVLFTAAVSYVIVIHLLFESLEPEVLRL